MPVSGEEVRLLAHVMKKNGAIDLPAEGTSMFPLIRRGDICRFVPCDAAALRKGDIALFAPSAGMLVAHRFYRTVRIRDQLRYLFKGDSNLGFDEPVAAQDIIGKLTCIRRNRAHIQAYRFMASLWGRIILSIPVSSRLVRLYLSRRGLS